jgi:NAD(P)-dependent dehydrogenase (short-subunit alcohol dehydrogenase family)
VLFAQNIIRAIKEHDSGGTLIFTGATSSTRGGAKFSAFSPTKFAIRSLSQSLAREFGPQGIHIAHVIVDGLIDTENVKNWVGESKVPDSRISPEAIAKAYVYLHEQDRSCWVSDRCRVVCYAITDFVNIQTQEMDVRPYVEDF